MPGPTPPGPAPDRRAWVRFAVPGGHPARAWNAQAWRRRRPARLLDLSPGGLGLLLTDPLTPGTVLQVAIDGWPGRPLWGFVRHVTATGRGWLHGCELFLPLEASDFQVLLAAVCPPPGGG
jgi:hypothetical protein